MQRPWFEPVAPEPMPTPRDPYVDYPPLLTMQHPAWWHVYRIEVDGPVLIAECETETAAHFVMSRERWKTRMTKWKHERFESFRPLKPRGPTNV